MIPKYTLDTSIKISKATTLTNNPFVEFEMEELHAVHPIDIHVRSLGLSIDSSNPYLPSYCSNPPSVTTIFEKVTLDLKAGTLTAIFGGSGSGKTSLLNVLSGRIQSSSQTLISGEIKFNNERLNSSIKNRLGYVQQQDFLLPYLTIRETLTYAASLRLSGTLNATQRKIIVEEVIQELGLIEAADTIVGDRLRKGISGGEKRRTSVGVQLLTNPSVLFLDEPTSGLDAFTSYNIVKTLQNLSRRGRNVILSIHQPRSDIFSLFDNIVLMSKGRLVYAGTRENLLGYFSSLSYECPVEVNIADFLIDISTIDNRNSALEEETRGKVSALIQAYEQYQERQKLAEITTIDRKTTHVPKVPIWTQLRLFFNSMFTLTSRSVVNLSRDRLGTYGHFIESIILGLILGYIFFQLPENLTGMRSRAGATYSIIGLQPYLLLILFIYRLCEDLKVFDRERRDGMYSVIAYLFGNFVSTVIPYSLAHFIFVTIAYFMFGFRTDDNLYYFGMYCMANLLHLWCGISFAWLCVAISRDFPISSLLANTCVSFLTLTCGFFISTASLPDYVKWIRYISSYTYAYKIILSAEMSDRIFGCPFPANDPRCRPYQGNFFLDSQDVKPNDFYIPALYMCAIWAGTAFITTLLLMFHVPKGGRMSKQVGGESKSTARKNNRVAPEQEDPKVSKKGAEIDIKLEDVKMSLLRNSCSSGETVSILSSVDASFNCGKLNIILGVSGGGKTSLLNMLANRLHGGFGETYKIEGKITWTNRETGEIVQQTKGAMKKLLAYVTQEDDRLLPSLTVRETLRYAAKLRLPRSISNSDKVKRAEEVLFMLGLKDCADTPVGNEFVKGISGGEKRRLSIGVQLLSDPDILLLDEPTSGLDAFSARSIMQLLKELANGERSGKKCTVICTIHQPRSDIYVFLDYILLLAKGGKTLYAGSREQMLPYFAQLGQHCPPMTNPADFAIDISTVDLRTSDAETMSRMRVQNLLQAYEVKKKESKIEEAKEILKSSVVTKIKATSPAFFQVFPVLVQRSYKNIFRQMPLVISRISQVVAFGAVLTLHFARLKFDFESIQTRYGIIQEHLALLFVGLLNNLSVYPQERNNFYMEHSEGVVSIGAFQLSYLLNEVPFEIFSSMVFIAITDWLGGMQINAEIFFINTFICFCLVNIGESVGIVFCTFFDHVGIAVSFTNLCLSLLTILSGIMSLEMPVTFDMINYIAPTWYGADIMVTQEFRNITFTCSASQKIVIPGQPPRCPISNGEEAMKAYNFSPADIPRNVAAIAALTLGYRFVSYLIMSIRLAGKRSG